MYTEVKTPIETSCAIEDLKIAFCAGFLLRVTACYSLSFSGGSDQGLLFQFPVSVNLKDIMALEIFILLFNVFEIG